MTNGPAESRNIVLEAKDVIDSKTLSSALEVDFVAADSCSFDLVSINVAAVALAVGGRFIHIFHFFSSLSIPFLLFLSLSMPRVSFGLKSGLKQVHRLN